MSRLPRIVLPGVPHHVTQRGNRRERTFFEDGDYALYLDLLADAAHKASTEIWSYCLMPNHVHIILVPQDADGLRRTFGDLHRRYTAAITGSAGPDRIVKNSYDVASQLTKVQTAYGVAGVQADEVTTGYTNNGKVAYVIDAENNRTGYSYDGHDRLMKTEYPSATKGANAVNPSDYEQITYDANGNVTNRRLRDGTSIGYGYDNLNRVVSKDLPGSEPDATYSYDLLGRAASAVQGGQTLSFTHDALGRNITQVGPHGTLTYGYDAAGRRTSMVYPGSALTVNYDYDVAGNVTNIRENGATSGVGVLAAYAFDNLGRGTSVTFGNGSVQSFGYDPVSRLSTLTNNLGGSATTHDLTQTFTYNPASQIASVTRSNDAYAWQAHYNVDRSYTINGLNRIMNAGSTAFTYDARGNLTSDGTNAFTYTAENLLKTGPASATLGYDPLGRLYQTVGGGVTTRLQYDGADLIAEYNGSNAVQRRYVHGPGIDNPIVWYEGSGTSDRRFLMADERGSIVSVTNSVGATININAYDEYGIPAPGNIGRFGYTGQTWLPELGMWYYKARIYSPTLGRFMQTDPIGYQDGMNWYNYVGSDPVNFSDPSGLGIYCYATFSPSTVTLELGGYPPVMMQRLFCEHTVDNDGVGGVGGGGGGRFEFPATATQEGPQKQEPSTLEKVKQCTVDQLGLGELAEAGAVAAGQPIPGTKPFVTPGSSRGTSLAGMAADQIFGRARSPVRLPTIVGGPGTGRALAIAGTKSVARFAGRAVPIVGWALLAYDAASIAACAASDD